MKYCLLLSLFVPYFFLVLDMWGNKFDACFSEKTKAKLRVKDGSFLRKIIPFKEKDIVTKDGVVYRYRYFLKIRAIPLFVYSLLLVVMVPLVVINLFVDFIPLYLQIIIALALNIGIILYEAIIVFCSQVLKL